jgi:hypothetical protein
LSEVFSIVRPLRSSDELKNTIFRCDNVPIDEGAILKNASQQILLVRRDHALALTPHLLDPRFSGLDPLLPLFAGDQGRLVRLIALLCDRVVRQTQDEQDNLTNFHCNRPKHFDVPSKPRKIAFHPHRQYALKLTPRDRQKNGLAELRAIALLYHRPVYARAPALANRRSFQGISQTRNFLMQTNQFLMLSHLVTISPAQYYVAESL